MKRTASRGQWTRLVGSALLSAAVLAGWFRYPPGHPPDEVLVRLQAEIAGLAGNEDADRSRLVAQRDRLARQSVPVPVDELKAVLGSSWTWQSRGGDRWLLTLDGAQPDGWPAFLADLARLESRPGVFIEEVELRGDGRAFAGGTVIIRLRGEGRETQPGLVPPPAPVSRPEANPAAPAVGRVRSLRRPGPSLASALSPGRPWLAPSRPDTRRGGSLLT